MGSPLASTLVVYDRHKEKWSMEVERAGPKFYKRYVDDVSAMFGDENEALLFLNYLNTKHPNKERI